MPRPLLVGILNITEDSFSDGGRYLDPAAAIAQARRLVAGGADIVELGAAASNIAAKAAGAVTVNYGLFINAVIRFVIVAFAIFLLVKQINRMRWQEAKEAPTAPPMPAREEVLLVEIRDLLDARLRA